MKAVAVYPGKADSAHLADLPEPSLDDVAGGRGVKVKILRVGLDGTDKEIHAGEYGVAPPGSDVLVIGHESFGEVVDVGPNVTEFAPGDYVVARVRQAKGSSIYDRIDAPDFTTDDTYWEHGISRVHGFLTAYYVEEPGHLVRIPHQLRHIGVLTEPTSVVAKGLTVAWETQRRLKVWQPRRAAVLGAGTIGLLATLGLRLRGLEVTTFALAEPPYLNSELVEALGAKYVSTTRTPLLDEARTVGGYDLVFECTGYSPLVFEGAQALAKNGVIVLSSVTGGDRKTEIPSDAINLAFVLGNRAMVGTVNANKEHFDAAVRDLAMSEAQFPGWLSRLLTHRVERLENFQQALDALNNRDNIKVYVAVAKT
jgi:threonine dehydrogenase-like Zn-dependent dehydrogenase